jgi:hypothetical protein
MERDASPRCATSPLSTRPIVPDKPLTGGEVPRLVAVEGDIDADGK